MEDKKYVRNPDVVLREEDIEGALLYNPDTNQVKVVNRTALFIWKICDGTKSMPEIVTAVRESFAEVPDELVENQVSSFMEDMKASSFLGIAE